MSAQLSLAQLDLRELNDSIPKEIGSVVLVSNADLDLSAGTIQRIHEQGSCLFVHHNHAHNLTRLRHHYPEQSCEMLFIRGNGIGYWGLVDSTKEPFYQRSHAIPHCGIFALRGKLDLSNRPEIQKINLNWLSTLEQQEN